MENKITKLKPIYEYTFSTSSIKRILQDIESNLHLNIAKLVEASNKDYQQLGFKINLQNLNKIVSKLYEEPILEIGKINNKEIIEGFGNIGLVYNGNPEITLKTILMAIKTHNNIILFPKDNFEVNQVLIEIISDAINSQNYYNGIVYLKNKFRYVAEYENFLDKVLFVGDKFEYIKLRKLLQIPIDYNGYGFISLIADGNNNLIESIKLYCLNNYINLDYYDFDLEDTLKKINALNINQTVAIFSNNQENIIKLVLKLKAHDIYINKNPLVNYKFKLEQETFINKKILK